jgi:hypothetical protein
MLRNLPESHMKLSATHFSRAVYKGLKKERVFLISNGFVGVCERRFFPHPQKNIYKGLRILRFRLDSQVNSITSRPQGASA